MGNSWGLPHLPTHDRIGEKEMTTHMEYIRKRPEKYRFDPTAIPWNAATYVDSPQQVKATSELIDKQFVVLDFWTSCCANCLMLLPRLQELHHQFSSRIRFLGVHCGKFTYEKDPEGQGLTKFLAKYQITHAILNDPTHQVMESFKVKAWPTLLVLTPDRFVVWASSDDTARMLDRFLTFLLAYYTRANFALPYTVLTDLQKGFVLLPEVVPFKLAFERSSGSLWVANSAHNTVFQARLSNDKENLFIVKTLKYPFKRPEGICLFNHQLFVADAFNHQIVQISLQNHALLNNNNSKGLTAQKNEIPPICIVQIASQFADQFRLPAALAIWDDPRSHQLYLLAAVARAHQIWKAPLNPQTGHCTGPLQPWIGCGREGRVDWPSQSARGSQESFEKGLLDTVQLAQPQALAVDSMNRVYIACSESSSIARLDVLSCSLTTISGGGKSDEAKSLFRFGDKDSECGEEAYLQHPIGMCIQDQDDLIVADTFNHKVKRIASEFPHTTATIAHLPDHLTYSEPSDVVHLGRTSYIVADTNHFRLIHIQLTKDIAIATPVSVRTSAFQAGPFVSIADPQNILQRDLPASQSEYPLWLRVQAPSRMKFTQRPTAHINHSFAAEIEGEDPAQKNLAKNSEEKKTESSHCQVVFNAASAQVCWLGISTVPPVSSNDIAVEMSLIICGTSQQDNEVCVQELVLLLAPPPPPTLKLPAWTHVSLSLPGK